MRIAIYLLAAAAICALGYRVWLGAQSAEDRIRWMIEDAEEGFNDTRLSPCLDLMGAGFIEETSGFDRGDVKSALVAAFFGEVDPDGGEFLLQLAIEDVEIAVTDATASTSFTAFLSRRSGEALDKAWVFRLEGDLEDRDEGWRFVRARFETLEGAIPR